MCHQQDRLYDLLTFAEHLELYARLKGVASCEVKKEMTELLETLSLVEEADSVTVDLRAGVKRLPCMALAFTRRFYC
jgi:ABC-type multidrug transport system ATPase subunit